MIIILLFAQRTGPRGGTKLKSAAFSRKITHSFYDPILTDNGNKEDCYVRTFAMCIKNKTSWS